MPAANVKNLWEKLEEEIGKRSLASIKIPEYITKNLKHSLFSWQECALRYFLAYNNPKNGFFKDPAHLMFNMATGSGKTMLMAAAMLYYYCKGRRHFLFFVNRTNIVEKTEDNFLNPAHSKYLFQDGMEIDGKPVQVKEVDMFSDDPQCMEIKFTSIQKLHNDIHAEKENHTTLDDLRRKDIVMLADEAHHLNTLTKKQLYLDPGLRTRASKEEFEWKGWEHTVVDLILNKGGKKPNSNVLLEFTATIPDKESVAKKYEDKIIYKFDLKEFLRKGYTKEINLISSTLSKKERVLQALVFAWYRHRVALGRVPNFKPVVLFRSKDILSSKQDHEDFLRWMGGIRGEDFDFLNRISRAISQAEDGPGHDVGISRTKSVLNFIKKNKIPFREIAQWVQDNYQERNVIITNVKTNKTGKETTDAETNRLLNSLEDKDNHIRAIFTVQRLTEGWDVFNLFDIVRLYEEWPSGGSTKKTPKATIQEKQLIGRGVRYFPFHYEDKPRNKRKFDNDLGHDLRALEELYFYTYDEKSRYISHLKEELKKDGYLVDDEERLDFDLKPEFKDTPLYQKGVIACNERERNPAARKADLTDLENEKGLDPFEYTIKALQLVEESLDLTDSDDNQERMSVSDKSHTIEKQFGDIERHIFYKALHKKGARGGDNRFRFENMTELLNIQSVDDLYVNLKNFQIHIVADTPKYENLKADDKLQLAVNFLERIFDRLEKGMFPHRGGEFMLKRFSDVFKERKIKKVSLDGEGRRKDREISKHEWYVLNRFVGTSEEEGLIRFIESNMADLTCRYEDVRLLKNEEVYKIYDFDTGKGFQPDYLLFLGDKGKPSLYYMVFIEPKGEIFMDMAEQEWKEDFLKKITKRHGHVFVDGKQGTPLVRENSAYRLYAVGLPFYNMAKSEDFKKEFREYILDAHGRNRMETEKKR